MSSMKTPTTQAKPGESEPTGPEIIAHRGASHECLENTLDAFTRALELRADALELDIHASRDSVLVVHHDPVVISAEGVTSAPISSLTARELAAIRMPGGHALPTLDAVFELVKQRAVLYLEVKASGIEELVAEALQRHPHSRVAVHSFDHRIPVAIRTLSPGLSIGLLSASYPLDVRAALLPAAAEAWWQDSALIDEAMVKDVHQAGARIIAWTVDDPDRARELAAWGVDGICTNVPEKMRQAVSRGA